MSAGTHVNTLHQPGLKDGLPAEVGGGHKDDAGAGDGGRRGVAEALHLEHDAAVVRHGDAVVVGQRQDLVVIQDRVQVLDPNCVNGPIANDPRVVLQDTIIPLLPDGSKHSRRPFVTLLHPVHLRVRDGLGVHDHQLVRQRLLGVLCHGRGEGLHDATLAAECWAHQHEAMPHQGDLIKLHDLQQPGVLLEEPLLLDQLFDGLFQADVGLLRQFRHLGEDILQEGNEQRHIIRHQLGQVHVPDRPHEQHLLVRVDGLISFDGARLPQDAQDVPQAEVVVPLLAELLFAEGVEDVELFGQAVHLHIAHRCELHLHDGLAVRHHH
mmetsp:Transcript_82350/g.197524  ORF Transcript_82350/g.197524 Transcript_82350/m.197524 type:complete len:323 (-) Transcript_82350:85-1053(-)